MRLFSLVEIRLFSPMRIVGGLLEQRESVRTLALALARPCTRTWDKVLSWLAVGDHQEEDVTTG